MAIIKLLDRITQKFCGYWGSAGFTHNIQEAVETNPETFPAIIEDIPRRFTPVLVVDEKISLYIITYYQGLFCDVQRATIAIVAHNRDEMNRMLVEVIEKSGREFDQACVVSVYVTPVEDAVWHNLEPNNFLNRQTAPAPPPKPLPESEPTSNDPTHFM